MEHETAKPRARRRRTGPWWLLGGGLVLGALAVALLVVPVDRATSSRTSIPSGSIDASGAELTAVLRTPAAGRAIATAAEVQARGLGSALEARRGPAGTIVVEYRAERAPGEMRRVTSTAARFLADAIAASALGEAERRVVAAETRRDRAAAALDDHQTDTGIADPDRALTASKQRLSSLQLQRDQAAATASALESSLEQQVASAQQEMFDLEAVSTRRAELVDARLRADAAVDAAEEARQLASERVDAADGTTAGVTVDEGSTDLPVWRVVAAGVTLALAVAAVGAATIGLARTRRRRPRVRTTGRTPRSGAVVADPAPAPRTTPGTRSTPVTASSATPADEPDSVSAPDGGAEAPRIELAEIERRLAELASRTAEVDDDSQLDHRS